MVQETMIKRNTAYKMRIGDILLGHPNMNGEKFLFLELGEKKISRVNVVASIVEKYEKEKNEENQTSYIFLTIDDGSGQIQVRIFGDFLKDFSEFSQGQTVIIIGLLRYWNNQPYIAPEIIKEIDPKYLLLRKLEIEKEKNNNSKPIKKENIVAIKDKILDLIKNSEEEGGIEEEKIIFKFQEVSPEIIKQEIKKFIEEGIVFEPRPGKIRWLG